MVTFIFSIHYIILLGFFYGNEACTNQTIVPCSVRDASTKVLYVNGIINSTGNCVLVQYGSSTILFDPVAINSVWITVTNKDNSCIANIPGRASTISASMSLGPSQEILLVDVTSTYLRMVVVPVPCLATCNVSQLTAALETKLASLNFTIFPIYNNMNLFGPYCLNGGTIDPTYVGAGYRCNCTDLTPYTGNSCEFLDGVITARQTFLNVFRNQNTLNVQFSFFSNGIAGVQNLFSIKNSSFSVLLQVVINESTIRLVSGSVTNTLNLAIDNQNWYTFRLAINQQNATLSINNFQLNAILTNSALDNFRSYYLVLNEPNTSKFSICIKSLTADNVILDLNSPSYASCCLNRCTNCSSNSQSCNCRPFISLIETFQSCYCKFGFQSSNSNCVQTPLTYTQMTDSVATTIPVTSSNSLESLDFGFQTLSTSGNLMTINLFTPPIQISIQIVTTNLTLNILNQPVREINYNVSDGVPHVCSLTFSTSMVQMTLDGNSNYSTSLLNWFSTTLYPSVTTINVSSLSLGMMQKPFISPFTNLTTCFSSININAITSQPSVSSSAGPNMMASCSSGPKCAANNIVCPVNQVCNDAQWQNVKCICIPNYSVYNSVCTSNQCIPSPCLNNGSCYLNAATNNTGCTCPTNYNGPTCAVYAVTTAGLWWIAILVVLLLLLIILIVLLIYCCCCRTKSAPTNAYIVKINENTAVYNEQAGECDYEGPPINFKILKKALNGNAPSTIATPVKPMPDFITTKDDMEKNNKDLVLDHPLEYGYEGYDSDNQSVSPIGSIGGDISACAPDEINQYLEFH